jgi:hypothetical protein
MPLPSPILFEAPAEASLTVAPPEGMTELAEGAPALYAGLDRFNEQRLKTSR